MGVIIGLVGMLTVLPPAQDLGMIFGLGSIVWFVGIGIILLRGQTQTKAGKVKSDSLSLAKSAQ